MPQQTRRQVNHDLLGDLIKTYLAHTLAPENHRVLPHSPESIIDTCAAFISHIKQRYGEHWVQARFDEHLRREDRDMPKREKAWTDALKSPDGCKA